MEKAKILLVNPQSGRLVLQYSHFPLGLSYVTQSLLDEGYRDVRVVDYNVHAFREEAFAELIARERFHVVGLTGLVTAYREVKRLSDLVKSASPETRVVLGGGLGTAFSEIVVGKTGVDVVVLCEGEHTIKGLVNTICNRGDLRGVQGICLLDADGNICMTRPRGFITDLDSVSFPNRALFPFEAYLRSSPVKTFHRRSRIATMYTSRGCPYACGYCFSDIAGRRFRHRSPENIIEEIELLRDRYGVTAIQFVDDVFTLKRAHTMRFCEELLRQGVEIDWLCSTRVDLVDDELLGVMKRAGCRTICYGIESASQGVLDEMNKRVTVEQAAAALERTWRAGIVPYCFFMIGYFGETEESIRETVDFCIKYGLTASFSFATPIPGTDFFKRAEAAGLIHQSAEWVLENWQEWQEGLNINVTSLSDERLKELRFGAEKEIARRIFVPNLVRYYRVLGPARFLRYGFHRLTGSH